MIVKEERPLRGSPSTTGNLRQRQKGGNDLPFGALWCACDRHVMRRPIGFSFDGSGIGSNEVKDFWMGI